MTTAGEREIPPVHDAWCVKGDIVDHNWAKSIYFKDPNGMQLEYCCLTREFNANDARMQDRFEISMKALQDPIDRLSSPSKGWLVASSWLACYEAATRLCAVS